MKIQAAFTALLGLILGLGIGIYLGVKLTESFSNDWKTLTLECGQLLTECDDDLKLCPQRRVRWAGEL